jgi:hypothetical protein
MQDFAKAPSRTHKYDVPTILIIGTSMSAGKTTSAKVVVRQLKRAGYRVAGAKLHPWSETSVLWDRDTTVAQPSAMQVQPMDAQPLTDFDRFAGRRDQEVRALLVRQTALKVAIHCGKGRAGLLQRVQIPFGPVPETNAEAHFVQARRSPVDRFVLPEHFGTSRELKGHTQISTKTRPFSTLVG